MSPRRHQQTSPRERSLEMRVITLLALLTVCSSRDLYDCTYKGSHHISLISWKSICDHPSRETMKGRLHSPDIEQYEYPTVSVKGVLSTCRTNVRAFSPNTEHITVSEVKLSLEEALLASKGVCKKEGFSSIPRDSEPPPECVYSWWREYTTTTKHCVTRKSHLLRTPLSEILGLDAVYSH